MYVLIDNYDSFTYNLAHYLAELGAEVEVFRNDRISVDAVRQMTPEGIVISPGPATPDDAGICLDLIEKVSGDIPILGVCLGHQAIGQVFGGRVIRANQVMHGKTSEIFHEGSDVFAGLPQPVTMTRYHSLIVDRASVPSALQVTATSEDGTIMGLAHRYHKTYGVQFHPESIASLSGHALLQNFLNICTHQVEPA